MSGVSKHRAMIRWVTIIAVILSILLGWELISSFRQLQTLEDTRAAAQEQLDGIEDANDSLEKQIEQAQTDDYIIRMARKLLGWVFPDDIRIIEESEP